ncbi:uncharacterized protein LOC6553566 [Drosophila erecta]|uniref:GG17087 n=1 Tax=Drosophila erecta TaxID=7220 RepID=B3P1A5_DROER|nr:uncharacterized protein LOC6553566 [Drosophila erecta]EDV49294.1 uncharacterized protein Dere_GG17087 [Drosophila erecta]
MAKSFSLTEEKLDDLFVEEVVSVVKLVGLLPDKDHIVPTCTRWLNIFQQSTPKERFSRNYMLLLLHKQLNDQKTLGYPFTWPGSFQLDLRTLHQMSLELGDKTNNPGGEDVVDCKSDESLNEEELSSFNSCENIEEANRRLVEENAALSKESQKLQCLIEKLELKRAETEHAIKRQNEQIYMLDKEKQYLKRIFACSSINALKQLCNGQDPAMFFDTLFSVLCEDVSDHQQVKHFNEHFKTVLHAHMDHYRRHQRALLLDEASQSFDNLKAKVSKRYKNVLGMKLDAESQELALSAMRYLSVLRNLFIDTFKGKPTTKKAVVKFLQNNYDLMNEML